MEQKLGLLNQMIYIESPQIVVLYMYDESELDKTKHKMNDYMNGWNWKRV